MPPSPCIEPDDREQSRLLEIARESITKGLTRGRALQLDSEGLETWLQAPGAVFITLTSNNRLRGCIGSLHATEPLGQAVADMAFSAAFRDRRFAPIGAAELEDLRIEISLLSEMEPIEAASRQALLEALQPGVDGLLMEDRGCRSTFLPKVWEKVGSAEEFLRQLFLKAGLGADHWSDTVCFHRYRTKTFVEK